MNSDMNVELVLNELTQALKEFDNLLVQYYDNKENNLNNGFVYEDIKMMKINIAEYWKLIKDDMRTIDFYKKDYPIMDKNIKEVYAKYDDVNRDQLLGTNDSKSATNLEHNELFDIENQNNKLVMAQAQINEARAYGMESGEEMTRQAQR